MSGREGEHGFSVELSSKRYLKTMKMGNERREQVLIEGFLGVISKLEIIEGSLLKVTGEYGTLRLDITKDEILAHVKELREGR